MNAPSHTLLSVLKENDGHASRKQNRYRPTTPNPGATSIHLSSEFVRRRRPRPAVLLCVLLHRPTDGPILDITAVNIALAEAREKTFQPQGPSDISWTITSYSLIFGSLPAPSAPRRRSASGSSVCS